MSTLSEVAWGNAAKAERIRKEVTESKEENCLPGVGGPDVKLKTTPLRKIVEITLGIILVIIGLIGGLIPVLQGWMFGIPGLILLAKHFKWAKGILEWAKRKWEASKAGGGAGGSNA